MPEQIVKSKGIFVYRFDYDLKGNNWHAYVAGYNQQECQEYLLKIVPHATVTGLSQEHRLDAISDQLRKRILDASKRKPGRPKGSGAKKEETK